MLGVLALATLALPLVAAPVARGQAPNEITYTKHVAPIIQQKCQVCHQPNSIGPMPLTSYEEVVKAARRIKGRVVARVMPPWHIDKNVGIRDFKNDRSLTDEQIETIVRWVDNGTPLGDPRDMPPAPVFPDPTGWQLEKDFGKPDLILKSPPFTLAARTQDKWFRPVTETGSRSRAGCARSRSARPIRMGAASYTTCSLCSSRKSTASRTSPRARSMRR
jgi:hypothetical protein